MDDIHYLHFGIILWGITGVVTVVVSLWTKPIPEEYLYRQGRGREKVGGGGYRLRIPETRWAEHSQSRVCVCRLDPDLEIDTGSFCYEGPPNALPQSVQ